jgi:hypothetical protein
MPGNHPKERIQQIIDVCFHEAMPKKQDQMLWYGTYFGTLFR